MSEENKAPLTENEKAQIKQLKETLERSDAWWDSLTEEQQFRELEAIGHGPPKKRSRIGRFFDWLKRRKRKKKEEEWITEAKKNFEKAEKKWSKMTRKEQEEYLKKMEPLAKRMQSEDK